MVEYNVVADDISGITIQPYYLGSGFDDYSFPVGFTFGIDPSYFDEDLEIYDVNAVINSPGTVVGTAAEATTNNEQRTGIENTRQSSPTAECPIFNLAIYMGLFCIGVVVSIVMIIYVEVKSKIISNYRNISNLTGANFLMILTIPFIAIAHMKVSWLMKGTLNKVVATVFSATYTACSYHLAVLCIICCRKFVLNTTVIPKIHRYISYVIPWLVGILVSWPIMLYGNDFREITSNHEGKPLNFYIKILTSVHIITEYIIPGAMMVVSITIVFGHARRNYKRYDVCKLMYVDIRVTILLSSIFLLAWCPYQILRLTAVVSGSVISSCHVVTDVTVCFGFISSILMPIVFMGMKISKATKSSNAGLYHESNEKVEPSRDISLFAIALREDE